MSERYQSSDWRRIHPLARGELLITLEGIKPSCIIDPIDSHMGLGRAGKIILEDALEGTRFIAIPNGNAVFHVSTREHEEEYFGRLRELGSKPSKQDTHRLYGWQLGYPDCCTDAYVHARFPNNEVKTRWQRPAQKSYKEAREQGIDLSHLDYRIHVPCQALCEPTKKLCLETKELLERYDPEAASALVTINRYGQYP